MPLRVDAPRADPALWSSEGAYALAIVRDGRLTDEYHIFTPPPQNLDVQTEPGVFVQPTQGPELYVEGLGMQSKVISIRGTSAVFGQRSPFDATMGMPPEAARALGAAESGFSLFHKLYKLYQDYLDETGSFGGVAGSARRVEMHFFNLKDGEFYHVEPLNFRHVRQVRKPLQYEYELQLRVLRSSQYGALAATVAHTIALVEFALYYEKLATVAMLVNAIAHDLTYAAGAVAAETAVLLGSVDRNVSRLLDTVELLDAARGVTISDLGTAIGLRDARRTIKRAVREGRLNRYMGCDPEGVLQYIPTTAGLAAQVATYTIPISVRIQTGFAASRPTSASPRVDLLDPGYDVYGEAVELDLAVDIAMANAPVATDSLADGPADLLIGTHELARRGQGDIAVEAQRDITSITAAVSRGRGGSGDLPMGSAAVAALRSWASAANRAVPSGLSAFLARMGIMDPKRYTGLFRRTPVAASHDVMSLAQEQLGDWRRWVEVVALNDLRWPYFSHDGTPGTVKYGDSVLLPTDDASVSRAELAALESMIVRFDRLSVKDVYLGLDAQLAETGDLVWDARGELSFVAGADAFAQNLSCRLSTLVGLFIPHPAYGLGFDVGSKTSPLQRQLWRGLLTGAIKADNRVLSVQRLLIELQGNVLNYTVSVVLRQLDEAITVKGVIGA